MMTPEKRECASPHAWQMEVWAIAKSDIFYFSSSAHAISKSHFSVRTGRVWIASGLTIV